MTKGLSCFFAVFALYASVGYAQNEKEEQQIKKVFRRFTNAELSNDAATYFDLSSPKWRKEEMASFLMDADLFKSKEFCQKIQPYCMSDRVIGFQKQWELANAATDIEITLESFVDYETDLLSCIHEPRPFYIAAWRRYYDLRKTTTKYEYSELESIQIKGAKATAWSTATATADDHIEKVKVKFSFTKIKGKWRNVEMSDFDSP